MVQAYTAPEHWKQANTLMAGQLAARWQGRILAMVERLETQARRLLQLEAALSQFAERYVSGLEMVVAPLEVMHPACADVALAASQCGAAQTRQQELRARYRGLVRALDPQAVEYAQEMQLVHAAYHRADLAALLGMEAELFLTRLCARNMGATMELETALYEVSRAADTYAEGYRAMLHSPLYEWMLRDQAAAAEGWDFIEATARKLQETVGENEPPRVFAATLPVEAH